MEFINFKAIPETQEHVLQSENSRYKPCVSDVSDCEVVDQVELPEKVSKVDGGNAFPIFNPVAMRKTAHQKIRQNAAEIQPLNPPRSDSEMIDLGKRRWVCVLSFYLNF